MIAAGEASQWAPPADSLTRGSGRLPAFTYRSTRAGAVF